MSALTPKADIELSLRNFRKPPIAQIPGNKIRSGSSSKSAVSAGWTQSLLPEFDYAGGKFPSQVARASASFRPHFEQAAIFA
jgi:hypothetical protein